jgi:hypothetical protein
MLPLRARPHCYRDLLNLWNGTTTKRFLLACTLVGAFSEHASATLTYTWPGGVETFPGTFVATVGNGPTDVGQIGNDELSGNAVVNADNNPSIYEFYWNGGTLNIQEELDNNGTEPNGIDVSLYAYGPSPGSAISTISFPYSPGGPPDSFETVYDDFLNAGDYSLDTYAAVVTVDPAYQVDFSGVSDVPEPMSFALLGVGLIGPATSVAHAPGFMSATCWRDVTSRQGYSLAVTAIVGRRGREPRAGSRRLIFSPRSLTE